MRKHLHVWIGAAAFLSLLVPGAALLAAESEAPETSAPREAIAMDGKVPAFALTDSEGKAFDSARLAYDEAAVDASLRQALESLGVEDLGPQGWKRALSDVPGLLDPEKEVDGDKVADLFETIGRPLGLIAGDQRPELARTLDDLRSWVLAGRQAPVVYMIWSPKCPTSRTLNDRIHEVAAQTGVRIFAIAGNAGDKPEHVKKFRTLEDFRIRVLMDPGLKTVDLLGGKRTPDFVLVDRSGAIRYRGALDNDIQDVLEGAERKNWLADAIAALQKGTEVKDKETTGVG